MTDPAKTLRDARQAAGMTIQELAAASGVTYARILSIEQGRSRGNIRDRHRLSDALRLPFAKMWPDSVAEVQELMDMVKTSQAARKAKAAR